eukprot:10636729-Lingulodinium_polyedra.AAC.1
MEALAFTLEQMGDVLEPEDTADLQDAADQTCEGLVTMKEARAQPRAKAVRRKYKPLGSGATTASQSGRRGSGQSKRKRDG